VSSRLRVLLVDDHAVVRAGYRHLLAASDGIEVVGEAADGAAAYRLFCELEPDVVVMDIALPGVSGIEVMRRMRARRAHAKILVFSIYEDAIYVTRALQAGSNGYLTKASAPEALVRAVRAVASGERYLSPDAQHALASIRPAANCANPLEALSAREFEVLGLLVQGLSLAQIGERLGLTGKTVANYQSTIRAKLGAENDFQLARLAEQFRLATATVDGGRG
jgi:DNA-binding NarL/FixJ family response regulator